MHTHEQEVDAHTPKDTRTHTGHTCKDAHVHAHGHTFMQDIHTRITHTNTHTHSNYKKRTHNKTYALTFATEVPIKADTTSVFAIHSRIYNNNNKMYCDNSDCRV